jgi:hypothetical protein
VRGFFIVAKYSRAIARKTVTYDLERLMEGATRLSCSQFGQAIIDNMQGAKRPLARRQGGGRGPLPAGTAIRKISW